MFDNENYTLKRMMLTSIIELRLFDSIQKFGKISYEEVTTIFRSVSFPDFVVSFISILRSSSPCSY